jgi:hypothetical protein
MSAATLSPSPTALLFDLALKLLQIVKSPGMLPLRHHNCW